MIKGKVYNLFPGHGPYLYKGTCRYEKEVFHRFIDLSDGDDCMLPVEKNLDPELVENPDLSKIHPAKRKPL